MQLFNCETDQYNVTKKNFNMAIKRFNSGVLSEIRNVLGGKIQIGNIRVGIVLLAGCVYNFKQHNDEIPNMYVTESFLFEECRKFYTLTNHTQIFL